MRGLAVRGQEHDRTLFYHVARAAQHIRLGALNVDLDLIRGLNFTVGDERVRRLARQLDQTSCRKVPINVFGPASKLNFPIEGARGAGQSSYLPVAVHLDVPPQ